MSCLLENPFYRWAVYSLKAFGMEVKHRDKSLKMSCSSRAKNVEFGRFNTLHKNSALENVSLGDFSYISDGAKLVNCSIGKYCSIGPECMIGLGKHPARKFVSTHPVFFSDAKHVQNSFSDAAYFEEFERISIGSDVWVGARAIISDGVNIADGAIVAAGAVVTKDVKPYAIVGGVPARVIRYRFSDEKIQRLLQVKWWDWGIGDLKHRFKDFHDIEEFFIRR